MNKTIQVESVSKNEFSEYCETHRATFYYKRLGAKRVFHRKNGPAVKFDSGHEEWYLDGRLHRENGPAVTFQDGTKEYWQNGKPTKPL